jgi:hypothetical protein
LYGHDEGDHDPDHGQQHEQEVNRFSQSQSGDTAVSQLDTDLTPTHGGENLPAGFTHTSAASFSTTDAVTLQRDSLEGMSHLEDAIWQSPIRNEQPTPFQSNHLREFSGSQGLMPFQSPNQSRNLGALSPQTSFRNSLVKSPLNTAAQTANSELEVKLLRYFIDVLACWFDICDPEKHFALVVPHRARWCLPLKNAILAASARHLTRVYNPASKPDFNYFHEGELVANLTEETALQYHSECIKELLQRSMDPEQTQDASLLAAAIILRFYEEIDAPLREDASDTELFLRVMNVFIDAQIPSMPVSSPVMSGHEVGLTDQNGPITFSSQASQFHIASSHPADPSDAPSHWRTDGLRHACFWVAFRQEIHSAFLKQRPFNLALSRCEAFRSFSPAEDAVWADRLVVFCADVLEFCYENTTNIPRRHNPSLTPKDRWLSLKQYEKMWGELLPASFEPIYFRDPDRSKGEVFPQICYAVDYHITGVQHVELARILLAVYDPTRPRLGPGYLARMRASAAELKGSVLRLCGIAMSNRKCPPAFVTAFLGIVMCGEHFEDPLEQEALLGVLDKMETDHGWPAGDTRKTLKEAWGIA